MFNFFKNFVKRIGDLLIKLISVKGLVFFIATSLMFLEILEGWIWFATAILIVSTRMFEKLIRSILPPKG